ncbi:Hypothetical_protein [Hexamita inflata]|uniref:Hypothetical_protein n=1 Tax=Hexamita inflata TaxID=28002 RepID=A0ABP1HZ72_9EUKA
MKAAPSILFQQRPQSGTPKVSKIETLKFLGANKLATQECIKQFGCVYDINSPKQVSNKFNPQTQFLAPKRVVSAYNRQQNSQQVIQQQHDSHMQQMSKLEELMNLSRPTKISQQAEDDPKYVKTSALQLYNMAKSQQTIPSKSVTLKSLNTSKCFSPKKNQTPKRNDLLFSDLVQIQTLSPVEPEIKNNCQNELQQLKTKVKLLSNQNGAVHYSQLIMMDVQQFNYMQTEGVKIQNQIAQLVQSNLYDCQQLQILIEIEREIANIYLKTPEKQYPETNKQIQEIRGKIFIQTILYQKKQKIINDSNLIVTHISGLKTEKNEVFSNLESLRSLEIQFQQNITQANNETQVNELLLNQRKRRDELGF